MADPTPHQLGAAATDSDGPPDRPLLKALGERSFALDSAERPGAPAAPSPSEPLRDFSVKMPNLMTQEVDFQGLPDQIRVALAFLRSFCPQDLMRDEVVAHFPPLLPPQSKDYADVELVDLLTVLDQCCLEASIPAFLAKRYGFGAFLQQQRQQQRLAVGAAGVFGMPPFTLV
mmetsp:Transcript_81018/g.224111  ORF Transcript_81018/g.224111 Transcript_81018/m.224111 type:complete len:173 (-) Transcript_81018:153-671(-)